MTFYGSYSNVKRDIWTTFEILGQHSVRCASFASDALEQRTFNHMLFWKEKITVLVAWVHDIFRECVMSSLQLWDLKEHKRWSLGHLRNLEVLKWGEPRKKLSQHSSRSLWFYLSASDIFLYKADIVFGL